MKLRSVEPSIQIWHVGISTIIRTNGSVVDGLALECKGLQSSTLLNSLSRVKYLEIQVGHD